MHYFIIFAAGTLLYGSLYLFNVAIAGIFFAKHNATLLAIVAMGVTYLSFSLNLYTLNRQEGRPGLLVIANCLTLLTILLGAGAGFLLLL